MDSIDSHKIAGELQELRTLLEHQLKELNSTLRRIEENTKKLVIK